MTFTIAKFYDSFKILPIRTQITTFIWHQFVIKIELIL
jgi:hypothetical protein